MGRLGPVTKTHACEPTHFQDAFRGFAVAAVVDLRCGLVRPLCQRERAGDRMVMLELQDALFSGTGEKLLSEIAGSLACEAVRAILDLPRLSASVTVFGELSIPDEGLRSATIVADDELICYTHTGAKFAALASETPPIAIGSIAAVATELGGRLRSANETIYQLETVRRDVGDAVTDHGNANQHSSAVDLKFSNCCAAPSYMGISSPRNRARITGLLVHL